MIRKWDIVSISRVARRASRPESVDASKTYRLLGAHWYAKGLYVKDEKLGAEIRADKLFAVKPGDFVYNRLFAWKGSFAIAEQGHKGCYVSNEFPCFELDCERIVPRFLWLYFSRESAWLEALGLSSGSTPTSRNRLKEDQFLQMQIPLPPIDEQRRIVARIEELAALIEEAQGLRVGAREEAEALRKATLRTVFFEWLADAPVLTVGEVTEAVVDNLHSTPEYSDKGFPCIRSPDVGWGKLDLANSKRTPEHEYLRRTRRGVPQQGDIVFVREGGGTGKAALVETEEKFSLGQRVMMFRPDTDKVDSKFFLFQILSPYIYDEQVVPRIKGSASPHVNIGALRQFRFLLPNLAKQRCIVAYLDDLQARVDELTALQDATQAELDALLPSVLDRAFRGEL